MSLNPENKCSHLVSKYESAYVKNLPEIMFWQRNFQIALAEAGKTVSPDAPFKDRIDDITVQWRNLCTEFGELMERLPYKEWKTYSQQSLDGFQNVEDELECKFEVADMFIFVMNIATLLGISGEQLLKIITIKQYENEDRQKRGY